MKSYHFCFFRPGFAAMSFAAKRSGRALLLILVCLFAWPVCMTAAVAAAPPAQTKEDVQPAAGPGLGKHQLVRAPAYTISSPNPLPRQTRPRILAPAGPA